MINYTLLNSRKPLHVNRTVSRLARVAFVQTKCVARMCAAMTHTKVFGADFGHSHVTLGDPDIFPSRLQRFSSYCCNAGREVFRGGMSYTPCTCGIGCLRQWMQRTNQRCASHQ